MLVFKFIKDGGVMMYPLIFCSMALFVIIFERALAFRKAGIDGDELLDGVKAVYQEGDPDSISKAIAVCEARPTPLGRVFARGLKNARRSADAMEMAIEQEASNELPNLEASLPVLKTIVNISPLLGLLGTIAGMITSFRAASQTGLSNPTQVLGGISEALVSTATGISIAVLGFIFYNYYANLSKKAVEDIEYYGSELVNFLTGRID